MFSKLSEVLHVDLDGLDRLITSFCTNGVIVGAEEDSVKGFVEALLRVFSIPIWTRSVSTSR
jgi:hypothetical protein